MGPLLPISEVLIPLELSGGTQDNHNKNMRQFWVAHEI